jgi:hypothetical protein
MVEITFNCYIDVYLSSYNQGTFYITLPIASINDVIGSLSIKAPYQCNGIVNGSPLLYSNDTTFIMNAVPFVAKFTYQAY